MTIPVYMSEGPPETPSFSGQEGNTDLQGFLQTLGSYESTSALQLSNPEAASEGTAIGLALVNPGKIPLGREIHKIAEALSQILHSELPPGSRKGSIIFLNSVILALGIQPDDLTFCLRETWAELGRKYYYACLSWDLDEDRDGESPEDQTHSQLRRQVLKTSRGRHTPTLFVNFDESEILMLGEYKSVDPLVHTSENHLDP